MPLNVTTMSLNLAALEAAAYLLSHPDEFVIVFQNTDNTFFHAIDADTIAVNDHAPTLMLTHIRFAGGRAELDTFAIAALTPYTPLQAPQ
jgi:hypothetical protein